MQIEFYRSFPLFPFSISSGGEEAIQCLRTVALRGVLERRPCADVQVAPHRQDVPGLQVRAVHRRSLVPERARRAGTLALATIR